MTKDQIQKIGRATYLISRTFTGKEPLKKVLERLILAEKDAK